MLYSKCHTCFYVGLVKEWFLSCYHTPTFQFQAKSVADFWEWWLDFWVLVLWQTFHFLIINPTGCLTGYSNPLVFFVAISCLVHLNHIVSHISRMLLYHHFCSDYPKKTMALAKDAFNIQRETLLSGAQTVHNDNDQLWSIAVTIVLFVTVICVNLEHKIFSFFSSVIYNIYSI